MDDTQENAEAKLSRIADNYLSQANGMNGQNIREWAADNEELGQVIRDVFPILRILQDSRHEVNELANGGNLASSPEEYSRRSYFHLAGDSRLGDFLIIRDLGRGGMGIVYEAKQISLNRRVALKVLPCASLLNDRQLERFLNEARTVAMLSHPNIVSIFSIGSEHGIHFFAMEMIDGVNLSTFINPYATNAEEGDSFASVNSEESSELTRVREIIRSPYDSVERWNAIADLAIQAVSAIEYAHQQGVLHRDIKPANLLLDKSGRLYMTDFGLARIEAEAGMTETGDLLGTLRYIPPEKICGDQAIDPRSDVYSLGVTLYELAINRYAYESASRERLVLDILHFQPIAPSRVRRGMPRDLETIILKAMSKESGDRYRSATELRLDLERFRQGLPILARPTSIWHHLKSWCRRRPGVAVLMATVLFLCAILAIGGPLAAWRQHNLTIAARQNLLHADMMLAYQAWHQGNALRAEQLLAKHPLETSDKPLEFVQQI